MLYNAIKLVYAHKQNWQLIIYQSNTQIVRVCCPLVVITTNYNSAAIDEYIYYINDYQDIITGNNTGINSHKSVLLSVRSVFITCNSFKNVSNICVCRYLRMLRLQMFYPHHLHLDYTDVHFKCQSKNHATVEFVCTAPPICLSYLCQFS